MMDFMKKLNPFKRSHHRQTDQSQQQDASSRQNQQHHLQTHNQHNNSDSKRKAADKELQHLNQKIEKILANLDENETGVEFSREEECVVCLSSKATMKTYPCGHCVVCRVCFVKTIQAAVSERRLPLKCVVCRTKILKLKQQRTSPARRPKTPNLRPSSWSRGGGGSGGGGAPSGIPARNRRTAGQDTAAVDAARSGAPSINHRPPGGAGGATAAAAASAASMAAHRPTATKLMQPLLIYPANARSGDQKRRPGPGWMSPPTNADAGTTTTTTTPAETVTTMTRLRTRNAPGSVGGAAGGGIGNGIGPS